MLRILPTLVATGPEHMALDEALLESALQPTLRLYQWSPPALSLGYFQDYADIVRQLPAPITVVRRITGGGAIWHEHEITYCLIGWLGRDGFPARMRECYALIHGSVLTALTAQGARLERQTATLGDRRYRSEPRCFASPAQDDLVQSSGGKTLGSAGRDRGGKVLIHGSLKLNTNRWDGAAVAGCGLDAPRAAAALLQGVTLALGLPSASGTLTHDEQIAHQRILTLRYGNAAWVQERRGPRP